MTKELPPKDTTNDWLTGPGPRLRAVLYPRLSKEEADKGLSIDSQLNVMRTYLTARGWANAGEYIDDGYSGGDTKRPAFQRMMANHSEWDVILVARFDRLHRDLRNMLAHADQLDALGKQLCSVREQIDTTSVMGRMLFRLLAVLAQLELEVDRERMTNHLRYKFKRFPSHISSKVSPGFRKKGSDGSLAPNDQALLVRDGINWTLKMGEHEDVAALWNRDGLSSWSGIPWDKDAVRDFLAHPRLAGFRISKIHPTFRHEGIIDVETYWRLQAELDRRAPGRTPSKKRAWYHQKVRDFLAQETDDKTSPAGV